MDKSFPTTKESIAQVLYVIFCVVAGVCLFYVLWVVAILILASLGLAYVPPGASAIGISALLLAGACT